MSRWYPFFSVAWIVALTACESSHVSPLPQNGGSAWNASDAVVPEVNPILQNGSFETPVVPSGSYTSYNTGQNFSHWTVVGAAGNVSVVSDSFVYNGYNFPAGCGKQWLDLTGTSQSKTGVLAHIQTVSGKTYAIAFEVGNAYDPTGNIGTSSTVFVYVNGKKIFSAKNTKGKGVKHQVWQKFSTQFTAQSTKASIKFLNGDPPTDTDNGLDCVAVTQV